MDVFYSKTVAKDFIKDELLEKITKLLPFTPIELIEPIRNYWSSKSRMCDNANDILNQIGSTNTTTVEL